VKSAKAGILIIYFPSKPIYLGIMQYIFILILVD